MSEELADVQEVSENTKTKKKKKDWKKEFKSMALIVVVVLGFRSVFFEPFKIPSGSMIPTLLIGDFILVNKFAYGLKVPFSDWYSDPIYITGPDKPKRGDVIVFKYPRDPDLNYIKRVVALPGEWVQGIDKVIYVNDEPIKMEEFDGSEIMKDMDDKFQSFNFKFFKTQTGEHTHIAQIHEDNVFSANFRKQQVPEGHYFVMGDNRDFSSDSRVWGFVPFENIKGKALLVWFSMSVPMPWSEPDDSFMFRPWRIGTMIDSAPGLESN